MSTLWSYCKVNKRSTLIVRSHGAGLCSKHVTHMVIITLGKNTKKIAVGKRQRQDSNQQPGFRAHVLSHTAVILPPDEGSKGPSPELTTKPSSRASGERQERGV